MSSTSARSTRTGTYRGAIEAVWTICEALGVTAARRLMPLAQPAGDRNWGYDGVAIYAPPRAPTKPPRGSLRPHRRRARARPGDLPGRRVQPLRTRRQLPAPSLPGVLHRPSPHAVGERGQPRWPRERARARVASSRNALHWLFDYGFDRPAPRRGERTAGRLRAPFLARAWPIACAGRRPRDGTFT